MKFEIPPDKMTRLIEKAKYLLSLRRVLVKDVASWVGLLQSCRLAIGPVVSIMCRSLYDCIKNAKTLFSYIVLSPLSVSQIQWWVENLPQFSEYPICKKPTIVSLWLSLRKVLLSKNLLPFMILGWMRLISESLRVRQ